MTHKKRRSSLQDTTLVEHTKNGDVDSYGELIARHRESVFRAAYSIAKDRHEADDATQEAFIKAFNSIGRFRRGAPFKPWISQIARNEARKRKRSNNRQNELGLTVAEDPALGGDAEPAAERSALFQERRMKLLQAIRGLRKKDQQIIVFRHFLELSEKQIAEILGCAQGTVKSRLFRALEQLRKRLPDRMI